MALPEIQRAVRHMRKGETEEAIAPLEQVVEHMPEYVTAHVLLARMYEATGRVDDALRTWRHAFFLTPNSPVIQDGLRRVIRRKYASDTNSSDPNGTSGREAPGALPALAFDQEEMVATEAAEPAREASAVPTGDDDDLDQLIEELESARIVPRPDLDDIPTPDLDDDIDDLVSETLARIYVSQEQFGEAARVYDKLAAQQPEAAERFEKMAAEMRERAGR